MSDQTSVAVFDYGDESRGFMRLFGVEYPLQDVGDLSARQIINLQKAGRDLGNMADAEDDESIAAMDALLESCITMILPTLPAEQLARIGFMRRIELFQAFMVAAGMMERLAQPQAPLTELHPKQPRSKKPSPTSAPVSVAN